MADENRIIMLLQKRDEKALQEIRAAYGGLCYALAYRLLGSREDAEECVSDMLLAAWQTIPPQEPQSLEAYLVTLVRRAAMDRLRTETRQKRGGRQFTEALDELAEIPADSGSVEDAVDSRALGAAIRAFLAELPAEQRRIFMQRYYLSLPLKEIAEQCGCSQSAVKMSLHRTRRKLQAYLRKEGYL
ncbi:MAG: sigma-70 family RNA polymerase sigma factor [Oscillospiraceae bacterium]|nr:sigma-70 family RNA polymerase sigma factor [Oscillospiraceae bacterium]